jgi:hypothetical protein
VAHGRDVDVGPIAWFNARGEVVVNGQLFGGGGNTGYVAKLDAEGGPAGVLQGVGYGKVAFGQDESVFVAGVGSTLGTTWGAFQKSHVTMACAGSGMFGIARTCGVSSGRRS